MTQRCECTFLCVHGDGGKVLPLPQHCILLAHEEAILPSSLLLSLWPSPLQLPLPSLLPSLLPMLLMSPQPITIDVAISHCCCSRCHPSLPQSLLPCRQPLPLPLPSPLVIALSVTIGNCSRHLHRPPPLPLLLPIAKSCCLGMARIVFEQFKQIMLT